jgi:hypothetical protein
MSLTNYTDFLVEGKENHLFMKKQVEEMKRICEDPKPNSINLFE